MTDPSRWDWDLCQICGQPLSDHDLDPIGAGLVQYTCPDPKETPV